jgi:hypothetical protein
VGKRLKVHSWLRPNPGELYYKARSKSMGKRELLLIAAFVIVGAIVYQFTAPPPAPGERSFSPGRIIESLRREIRGNRASAETTRTSVHRVDSGVSELRVLHTGGELTITGENRADIEAQLWVHSNGYDEAEARQFVKESTLKIEQAGSRIIAEVTFPEGGRQRARLLLKVPARLRVSLDSITGLKVTDIAEVELVNTRGQAQLRKVAGRVTGTHRGGSLLIADSGPLKLTTFGADVDAQRIRGEVTFTTRSGDLKGTELAGPIEIDANGTDVVLDRLEKATGILRINAASGSVVVKGLRTEGRIDVRGSKVDVIVDRAVPLAIYSDGRETVSLTPPAGGYTLDAVASHSEITVAGGTVPVATNGQEQRATGAVKGGGPTITIRTARGPITVRAR